MKKRMHGYHVASKRTADNDYKLNIAKNGVTFINDMLQPFHEMMQNK